MRAGAAMARVILAAAAAAALAGCSRSGAEFGDAKVLNHAAAVGTAPMFAVSRQGTQAAAWVSAPGGGTDGSLYISVDDREPAVLKDSLGPIEAHGESPPKLAFAPDGTLSALYVVARVVPGKRFPEAALRFVRSTDGGRTWTPPTTVTDDSLFASHNFHALHASADGTLYVAWLDGRMGKSAVFLTKSTDGGQHWEKNRRIAEGEACPCCRTAIASAPNGVVYLGWREVAKGNVRDIVVAKSVDGGQTFGTSARVHADDWVYDGCPHAGPSLQVDGAGRLHVAWWTGKEGSAGVWYAQSDDGVHFHPAIALGVARHSMPAHVQLAMGADNRLIAAWDDGTVKQPRVVLRVSRDGGASFGATQNVSAANEAGTFPVIAVRDLDITVAWTSKTAAAQEMDEREKMAMKDPKHTMPLAAVGEAAVMVRRGRISD